MKHGLIEQRAVLKLPEQGKTAWFIMKIYAIRHNRQWKIAKKCLEWIQNKIKENDEETPNVC